MVKTLTLPRGVTSHATRDPVTWPHPRTVQAGDVTIVDADTRLPVIVQLTLPPSDMAAVLAGVEFSNHQRTSGLRYTCRTFGTAQRLPVRKREACAPSSFDLEHPDVYARLAGIDLAARDAYRRHIPHAETEQSALIAQVLPEWRITRESWWTSGIINHTAALTYHRDANNFPGSWSAQAVYRDGVRGGMLSIPEYNVTLACHDHSLVLFQGVELLHGVTPFRLRPGGYRFSVVFYAVANIRKCLPCDEEFAQGKRARTAREHA